MTDFVTVAIRDLDNRISELREERSRLEAARTALVGPTRRTSISRRWRSPDSASATRGPGRHRGTNARTDQVLKLISKTPGITVPQLAAQLNIQPNYLYRLVPRLVADDQIVKNGRGLHPVTDSTAASDS